MPVGVIAGKKAYMDTLDGGFWRFGDDSIPESGVTYFAGTFVRHPLAMASMHAVLEYLEKEGQPLIDTLNGKCTRLVDAVNRHARTHRIPYMLVGFGSLFKSKWDADVPYAGLLFALMRHKGVHIMDGFPCFLSLAFSEADVDTVIRVFCESLSELTDAGFIPRVTTEGKALPGQNGDPASGEQPPVPGARLGRDAQGNPGWFIPDPERPGKYLQIK